MVYLRKFEIETGTAVKVDDEIGIDYGYATTHPYSIEGEFVVDVRNRDGYFDIYPIGMVTETAGCECGNPFVRCHPEA